MKQYLELLRNVLEQGEVRADRTGTGTLSVFGTQTRYHLGRGFPLLTTKKVLFKAVVHELLWFLRGSTNIHDGLTEHTPIWDAWADEDGHVGPIYPVLWRRFPYLEKENVNLEGIGGAVESETWVRKEFDQVQRAIDMLKTNPNSRRIVVSTWHPGLLGEMALPPCHIMYIFNVSNGKLNCHLTQRSGDIALGIPFNLACYSALTMAIAQEVGLEPGTFAHTIVDAHIYVNHVDGLKEQLKREPRELPTLEIAKKPVDELTFDDFKLHNYDPDPVIKFEVAV